MILPKQLGRYEVESLLGLGGMGAVYKGRDPVLDRVVALKTINPLLVATAPLQEEYLERFRREARAAGRLSHPNIVSVYDMGLDEATATPFIVMEYVAGVTLETLLKENPALPVGQGLEIVADVSSALEEAHRNGVVHRDIKPANIFLDGRGRVKVGDFGVARLEGSDLTQTGLGMGTPGYLAPEVAKGGVADARSDVFALGVLAYRVLTGIRPFEGETREALALDIFHREPAAPRTLRGEIPEHVSAAVLKALEKTPESRTPTAEAFLRELQRSAPAAAVAEPATAALEPTGPTVRVADPVDARPPTQAALPPRRRGIVGIGLLVAALVAVAFAVGAFLAARANRQDGPTATATPSPSPRPTAVAVPRPVPAQPTLPAATESDPADILREAARRAEERLREELRQTEARPRGQGRREKKRKDGRKAHGKDHDQD